MLNLSNVPPFLLRSMYHRMIYYLLFLHASASLHKTILLFYHIFLQQIPHLSPYVQFIYSRCIHTFMPYSRHEIPLPAPHTSHMLQQVLLPSLLPHLLFHRSLFLLLQQVLLAVHAIRCKAHILLRLIWIMPSVPCAFLIVPLPEMHAFLLPESEDTSRNFLQTWYEDISYP